jgi:hypothetical protein
MSSNVADATEAVIISGKRRGEIIRLNGVDTIISDAELSALNEALDQLNTKLARVSKEVRACSKLLKTQ